jgi:hypothetical protein
MKRPAKRPRRKGDDGLTEKSLDYLAMQPDVWAERRNSGSILIKNRDGSFRHVYLGEPGTPDITLVIRVRRGHYSKVSRAYEPSWSLVYAGIETKRKGGKLNPAQRLFHAKAEKWGMPICTAKSLEDVKLFLEGLRK